MVFVYYNYALIQEMVYIRWTKYFFIKIMFLSKKASEIKILSVAIHIDMSVGIAYLEIHIFVNVCSFIAIATFCIFSIVVIFREI